jgi:hypothetical protein
MDIPSSAISEWWNIGLEQLGCISERRAVLLHRRQHNLTVGHERLGCVMERMAVLLHRRQHNLTPAWSGAAAFLSKMPSSCTAASHIS